MAAQLTSSLAFVMCSAACGTSEPRPPRYSGPLQERTFGSERTDIDGSLSIRTIAAMEVYQRGESGILGHHTSADLEIGCAGHVSVVTVEGHHDVCGYRITIISSYGKPRADGKGLAVYVVAFVGKLAIDD